VIGIGSWTTLWKTEIYLNIILIINIYEQKLHIFKQVMKKGALLRRN
jgi:hypothetical protein